MLRERALAERRERGDELTPLRHRERRGDADVMQVAAIVVQPELQRADALPPAVLVPPEAGDDAVGCARVLHFDHCALPRLVDEIARLHDHAVEAGALEAREPLGGHGGIARRRREMDWRLRRVERELEAPPALVLRRLPQILAVERERVE